MTTEIDTYVHRIGRTARAGKDGVSITFFSPSDISIAPKLKEILIEANQEVPKQLEKLISLQKNSKRSSWGGDNSGGRYEKKRCLKFAG